MGGEELGLDLSSVTSLPIPVFRTESIDRVSRSSGDGDVFSGDGEKRSYPLGVAEAVIG